MANNLIPEELNALIQHYLTDGVLTDKERLVILNKAEKMGLDRDEIDLYLDAEVQKIDQQTDAAVRKQKGKTCPYCGGSVPQLTDKCPHCGQNITPEASSELQEIFDNLEEALVDLKSGNDIEKSKATVERYARKAKMYYGSNPKIQKLLEEIETETINAEKKAKSLARKNTLVSILTYNKKLTAGIVVALLIAIVWGIASIFHETPPSDESIIKEQSVQVSNFVKNGDLASADEFLVNLSIPESIREQGTAFIVDNYDAMFFSVINAYIKNGDLDSAESLALVYKSKIGNDLSWKDSSCYKTLKAKFNSEGRDFSALQSDYDYNVDL